MKIHSLLLLFALMAALLPSKAFPEAPFKVGVVLPLTAASGAIGNCVKNSVILADEQRDTGGRVDFIFEDDGLQAARTVPAVQKLMTMDKVQALIIYGTPTSLAVNAIAESNRLPMIALSILDKVVTGKKYVVKHWAPSRILNEKIVDEVRRRGYKRVAIVAAINDAMLGLRDHFVAEKPAEIVLNEELEIGDVDFRTLSTRVRASNPDAVYLLLWPPQPGLFAKTMRRAGYQGAFFGAHNIADVHDVEVSEGAMEGSWFAVGQDDGNGYKAAYEARFHEPVTPGGADGYDAAALMIEGIKQGRLNEYLHQVRNFSGASGNYDATDRNDFQIPVVLKKVREGRFVSGQ